MLILETCAEGKNEEFLVLFDKSVEGAGCIFYRVIYYLLFIISCLFNCYITFIYIYILSFKTFDKVRHLIYILLIQINIFIPKFNKLVFLVSFDL